MQTINDTQLRQLARKRVEFRTHLLVYIVINASLWAAWYFTGSKYPWPVWPMAGWGVGLVFHYLFDYRPFRILSEEKEFEKLKKQFSKNKEIIS